MKGHVIKRNIGLQPGTPRCANTPRWRRPPPATRGHRGWQGGRAWAHFLLQVSLDKGGDGYRAGWCGPQGLPLALEGEHRE